MKTKAIQKWLRQNGYTQTKIARDLGISKMAVTQALYNRSTISRVVKWLLEHGCPEEYLEEKKMKEAA